MKITPIEISQLLEGRVTEVQKENETQRVLRSLSATEALYRLAVSWVKRERRASVLFLRARLGINQRPCRAFLERMTREGIVSVPNQRGHREVLSQ